MQKWMIANLLKYTNIQLSFRVPYPCVAMVTSSRTLLSPDDAVFQSARAVAHIYSLSPRKGEFMLEFIEECALPNGSSIKPGDKLFVLPKPELGRGP